MGKKSIYDENEILKYFTASILDIGYDNTSMRMIAQQFNMPVSSLYRHFASKEEMLDRVLKPVIDLFNDRYNHFKKLNYDYMKTMSLEEIFDAQRIPLEFLDMLYKFKNEFLILLSHLKGTKYENYLNELINLEIDSTKEFFIELKKNKIDFIEVDYKYIKIITEATFNSYFSVLKNGLSYEEGKTFFDIISDYNTAGYKALFLKK